MRFAFFAPVVVGEVAYAAVFRLMFNRDFGIVNKALGVFGIPPVDWFANPTAAMAVIIIAVTGAGSATTPSSSSRACSRSPRTPTRRRLDRVTPAQQFFNITLPLLKPVIVFCVVLSVIGTMQLFTEPFLITNRGGPGGATETLRVFPPPWLHRAQLRLRLRHRLHDRGARGPGSRSSISGSGGNA